MPQQLSGASESADQKQGVEGLSSFQRAGNRDVIAEKDQAHRPSVGIHGAQHEEPDHRLSEEAKVEEEPAREMRSIQSSDHQFVSVNDLNIQSQQFADSLPKFERHLKTPQQHPINSSEERMAGRPNEEAKVNPDQVKVGKFGSGTPSKSGAHLNSSTKAR